jgi:hypothetical protein
MTNLQKGGAGSGNHGHAGRVGYVGGSSPTRVGITSDLTVQGQPTTANQVYRDMNAFADELKNAKGVKDVKVQFGRGGWAGGSEHTWVVSYTGNGEALKLVAKTAKAHSQRGVLMMYPDGADKGTSSILNELVFTKRITSVERDVIEQRLDDLGFGGWTWFKDGKNVRLRLACVPQWGGNLSEHRVGIQTLTKEFGVSQDEFAINVDIMELEGDNSYDKII